MAYLQPSIVTGTGALMLVRTRLSIEASAGVGRFDDLRAFEQFFSGEAVRGKEAANCRRGLRRLVSGANHPDQRF